MVLKWTVLGAQEELGVVLGHPEHPEARSDRICSSRHDLQRTESGHATEIGTREHHGDGCRRREKVSQARFSRIRGAWTTENEEYTKRWEHFGTDEGYLALEMLDPPGATDRKPYRDPGVNHIGFVVDDLPALRDRLMAAGYRAGDLREEGEGPARLRSYIFDDLGMEWEFVQYLTEDVEKMNVYEP